MNRRDPFETLLDIVAGQFEGPPARPKLDWADDLAIDILADAQRNSFRDAEPDMTLDEFHNGLRLLRSIDAIELGDPLWYPAFRDDPFEFFIRCDHERAALIWLAMEKRGLQLPTRRMKR